MLPISSTTLFQIAPDASGLATPVMDAIGPYLVTELGKAEINTPLRIANFLGQCAEESDGFQTLEEYASGADYEGRADLGNTQPGDGRLFKGRGLIELTGRANYASCGGDIGVNLVDNPDLASTPQIAVRTACWFWNKHGLNAYADRDAERSITRIINGGYNGLAARLAYVARAKVALANMAKAQMAIDALPNIHPVLVRGMEGDAIEALQRELSIMGYALNLDGSFGPATELAVKHFQTKNGLTADGIVGRDTWAKLG